MRYDKTIEEDISNPRFFLQGKYITDFFFFFFFRCLYAVVFYLIYYSLIGRQLSVNVSLKKDSEDSQDETVLFVGDSTITFPIWNFSFPYIFFQKHTARHVDIMGKPWLDSRKLYEYICPILHKKYDKIFVACFLNEIIDASINEEEFRKSTEELIMFLKEKLSPGGRIIYIYGDFSLHPIVPDNYFKKYFHYKTVKFINFVRRYESDCFEICKLMDFGVHETRKENQKLLLYGWVALFRKRTDAII